MAKPLTFTTLVPMLDLFMLQTWVRITSEVLSALDCQRYVVLSQVPGAQCARNRCATDWLTRERPRALSPTSTLGGIASPVGFRVQTAM